jgi:hypothetical protein
MPGTRLQDDLAGLESDPLDPQALEVEKLVE